MESCNFEQSANKEYKILDASDLEAFEWAESDVYSHLASFWEPGDPVYVKRRNQTPPSDELNVITIYVDDPPIKYPPYLCVKEKRIPTGTYPAIIEKRTFNSAPYLFSLFYDVKIVNGPTIKMCAFQPLDKWNPDFKDFPKPGDLCRVYIERIRLKRANFKPHMRRRLKAVRR